MEQQETSYLSVNMLRRNDQAMYTSSMTEQSGAATTNKEKMQKWLGWRARGRLERRAFTAHRFYTYILIHSRYEQANYTTHQPLNPNKLNTSRMPHSFPMFKPTLAPTLVKIPM
jgi:hypothetical protein